MKCPHCNTTDHPTGGRYCHICGTALTSATMAASQDKRHAPRKNPGRPPRQSTTIARRRHGGIWASILRYLFLACLLLEIIFFCILESELETGWWITLITLIDVPTFFCALSLCISTDIYGNDTDKGFWKIYHDWLHIFAAALIIVLAYLIVFNIQNLLTFLLLGLLMLPLVVFNYN